MVQYEIENSNTLSGNKVLIFENDEVNQLLLKIMLENNELQPEIITDTADLYKKIESHSYELLLLDMENKNPSSFEIIDVIRKDLKSNIPVIGLSTKDYRGRAIYHGINVLLQRPIENRALMHHIMRVLYGSSKYKNPITVTI
ncbi:MAG: PleD family two-component system response regulator [Thermaurantimonas sp.]|uniref:response regulator n=1 Tax=Thermaurantimonas sp. TaxID=2681568 RepID=UPI00391C59F6